MRRVGTLVVGAMCLAGSGLGIVLDAGAAHASGTPGSAFGSYGLIADAPGWQFTYDAPNANAHPELEGEVPYAYSSLDYGPRGYALSTVTWPGSLAGHPGATLQLIWSSPVGGVPFPPPPGPATSAAYPIKAEANTAAGTNNATQSYPFGTWQSTATGSYASAYAKVNGAAGGLPSTSTGQSQVTSTVQLTGPKTAVGSSDRRVQNVSLAGGLVTIGSVVSSASGTTNAATASAHGFTQVNDMKIGGVPVTVDENGVHVQSQGGPYNQAAATVVNDITHYMGMTVTLSRPVLHVVGAAVSYEAGSLIIDWKPPQCCGPVTPPPNPVVHGTGNHFTVVFGGAQVILQAGKAYGFVPPPLPPLPSSAPVAAPAPVTGAPVTTTAGAPPTLPSVTTGSTAPAQSPQVATSPAAATLPGSRALSPVWLVLALLGSGLIAAGMRRLPDRVLEATATTCPLGDES